MTTMRNISHLYLILIFCNFVFISMVQGAEIHLQWDKSNGTVNGYRLYYGTATGTHPNKIDAGNVTEYVITNLLPNSAYYFTVRAYNEYGESGDSNEVSWPKVSAKITPSEIQNPMTKVTFQIHLDPAPSVQAKYEWNFQDGSAIQRTDVPTITHLFIQEKEYTVRVKILFPNESFLNKTLKVVVHDGRPKSPTQPLIALQ